MGIRNICPEGQQGAGEAGFPGQFSVRSASGKGPPSAPRGSFGRQRGASWRRASRSWKAFLEMCFVSLATSVRPAHAREHSPVTYLVHLDQRPHKPATPAAAVLGTRWGRGRRRAESQPARLPPPVVLAPMGGTSACSFHMQPGPLLRRRWGEPGCAPISDPHQDHQGSVSLHTSQPFPFDPEPRFLSGDTESKF